MRRSVGFWQSSERMWRVRRPRASETVIALATNQQPHPAQIAAWRPRAREKLAQVYDEKGRRRAQNRDAELTKLQARNGQLMVNAIVWRKPSIDAPLRAVAQIGAGMVAGMVAIPAPAAFS